MYKIFRSYLTKQDLEYVSALFNDINRGRWHAVGSVNSSSHIVDYNSSRKAVAQSANPSSISKELKNKILKAVQDTDSTRAFEFIESWSINKYKGESKGHFYWHKDRLEGFMYHGSNLGKLSSERIFINNLRPPREMSVSVALNDRNMYNGGQFILDTGDGKKTPVDLNAGDMVVFDSDTYHGVEDVVSGERQALVIWLVDQQKLEQWKQLCLEQGIETT